MNALLSSLSISSPAIICYHCLYPQYLLRIKIKKQNRSSFERRRIERGRGIPTTTTMTDVGVVCFFPLLESVYHPTSLSSTVPLHFSSITTTTTSHTTSSQQRSQSEYTSAYVYAYAYEYGNRNKSATHYHGDQYLPPPPPPPLSYFHGFVFAP